MKEMDAFPFFCLPSDLKQPPQNTNKEMKHT